MKHQIYNMLTNGTQNDIFIAMELMKDFTQDEVKEVFNLSKIKRGRLGCYSYSIETKVKFDKTIHFISKNWFINYQKHTNDLVLVINKRAFAPSPESIYTSIYTL